MSICWWHADFWYWFRKSSENQVFAIFQILIKGMGKGNAILDIKIIRDSNGIYLTKSHYIEKVLWRIKYQNRSLMATYFDPTYRLTWTSVRPIAQLEYAKVIWCLMYAMTSTRPNMAFVFGKLSQFTSNSSKFHWHAIHLVLKHLKQTQDYCMFYLGYASDLKGYSATSCITRKENYASMLGWVLLAWWWVSVLSTKETNMFTESTMVAEFIALIAASKRR